MAPMAIGIPQAVMMRMRDVCADAECKHLIGKAEPFMKRALVSGDAKGEISNVRTNSVGW
jgi:hypothetical protein